MKDSSNIDWKTLYEAKTFLDKNSDMYMNEALRGKNINARSKIQKEQEFQYIQQRQHQETGIVVCKRGISHTFLIFSRVHVYDGSPCKITDER